MFVGFVLDGGFYIFESWLMLLCDQIVVFVGLFYVDIVVVVMMLFIGDVVFVDELKVFCEQVYGCFVYVVVMFLVQFDYD